ncbi:MAG: helix-turn-helix transcriptional regulator [Clostridia bacterium]|nr:helix-turn-helix transcriptional regulator [Clostridia bacterium]
MKKHKLAERLEVGQCTLSRWFTGSMPETAILIRIANLLDISLEELLGRE